MTETIKATFRVLVHQDGQYQVVTGSSPIGWIGECLENGGVIHTVTVDLPAPPEKPTFLGRILGDG